MKKKIYKPLFLIFLFVIILLFPIHILSRANSEFVRPEKGVLFASPSIAVSDSQNRMNSWGAAFHAVYRTLQNNLHEPNNFFKTRYAFPSPIFRGVYLWDTAFIAQAWKPWDAQTARDINSAVLDHADNGRLQHLASRMSRSDYTQPPVMTWSVWENYLWSNDKNILETAYPILAAYNKWLYRNRRLPNGLFFWAHPYESGIDNSPRFGSGDESNFVDTKKFAAVDLSSYMVLQNETLAKMSGILGKQNEAAAYDAEAETLRKLMNGLLWDAEAGYYFDLDIENNELVKFRTIASMLPLFAGVPDKDRAKIIRDHVMNPKEFNTPIPLPSVARDDPSFEKDCWRGPVWINTAYMVILGLERYGYLDEAAELSFRLVDGVYKSYDKTGKIVEFYDPDKIGFDELHRKRGNLYKLITLGDKPRHNFAGWTALVNTIVIEHLIGFKKTFGKSRLEPRFPDEAVGASFKLDLPAEGLRIEMKITDRKNYEGKIIFKDESIDFSLSDGAKLDLTF